MIKGSLGALFFGPILRLEERSDWPSAAEWVAEGQTEPACWRRAEQPCEPRSIAAADLAEG